MEEIVDDYSWEHDLLFVLSSWFSLGVFGYLHFGSCSDVGSDIFSFVYAAASSSVELP